MSRIFMSLTVVLACLSLYGGDDRTQREVLQAEHNWVQRALDNDVDKMGNSMSEKWIALFSDGTTIDKPTWMEGMRSGKNKFYKVEFNNERVIVHDPVAIFIGQFTEKGVWDGQNFDDSGTEMSTYMKENGKWQVISSAFGHPPKPEKN